MDTQDQTNSPRGRREAASPEDSERRAHRRMDVRLPVELRLSGPGDSAVARAATKNVSTGGMYVELDSSPFKRGDRLAVRLTLPPREGVFPYEGRASCTAEVIRVELASGSDSAGDRPCGVAARFLDRIRLDFPD